MDGAADEGDAGSEDRQRIWWSVLGSPRSGFPWCVGLGCTFHAGYSHEPSPLTAAEALYPKDGDALGGAERQMTAGQ